MFVVPNERYAALGELPEFTAAFECPSFYAKGMSDRQLLATGTCGRSSRTLPQCSLPQKVCLGRSSPAAPRYPFSPLVAMPWMKVRWAIRKSTAVGTVNMAEAAISGPHAAPCWPK